MTGNSPEIPRPTAGPVVVHRYWFVEQRSGRRMLTSTRMTAEEADKRHPGSVPDPNTRERRWPGSTGLVTREAAGETA